MINFTLTKIPTRKALDHDADEVAEVRLHLAYAAVVFLRFRLQIQPGALDVLDKRRMQRHRVALDDARRDAKRPVRGHLLQHLDQLQPEYVTSASPTHVLLFAVDGLTDVREQLVHEVPVTRRWLTFVLP